MLIDDLINKLNSIRNEHGNIQVHSFPYDGQMNSSPMDESAQFYVSDEIALGWDAVNNKWITENCEKYLILE